jgi:hypothetical protein
MEIKIEKGVILSQKLHKAGISQRAPPVKPVKPVKNPSLKLPNSGGWEFFLYPQLVFYFQKIHNNINYCITDQPHALGS